MTKSGKLPPVVPIVLYNGTRPWTAPLQVAELIESMPDKGWMTLIHVSSTPTKNRHHHSFDQESESRNLLSRFLY